MARPFVNTVGAKLPFFMPNIRGKKYAPGNQVYDPGESHVMGAQIPRFKAQPWPNAVPSLVALANHPGIPRARALQIDNNSEAVLPANWLYLSGFAGKSRG